MRVIQITVDLNFQLEVLIITKSKDTHHKDQ